MKEHTSNKQNRGETNEVGWKLRTSENSHVSKRWTIAELGTHGQRKGRPGDKATQLDLRKKDEKPVRMSKSRVEALQPK
jgi:hypothetical protein